MFTPHLITCPLPASISLLSYYVRRSQYNLTTHFIVLVLRILMCPYHIPHRFYPTHLTVFTLRISPRSDYILHLTAFPLHISPCFLYIPHLTSLPVSSCSYYVSYRLITMYLTAFTLHIPSLSPYLSQLILTSYLTVFTRRIWSYSSYISHRVLTGCIL
jgi:hypothetical protein